MNYKYLGNENFEDFACGRVIYHKSGFPNFPVRLAGEIYMNCLNIVEKSDGKATLYDPCCGGGYLLTVLGFLCNNYIDSIYASDISAEAVILAENNLNLLTIQGLNRRKAQLIKTYNEFGKKSHSDAIQSADSLSQLIKNQSSSIDCTIFPADMMNENSLLQKDFKADIVFTDVPYGNLVSWSENNFFAIDKLLNTIIPVLSNNSVVAICSNKSQKITNPQFKRIKKVLIGKRKVEYFIPQL